MSSLVRVDTNMARKGCLGCYSTFIVASCQAVLSTSSWKGRTICCLIIERSDWLLRD